MRHNGLLCDVKRCRRPATLGYYGKGVCSYHWQLHCDETRRFNLKQVLGLRDTTPTGGRRYGDHTTSGLE